LFLAAGTKNGPGKKCTPIFALDVAAACRSQYLPCCQPIEFALGPLSDFCGKVPVRQPERRSDSATADCAAPLDYNFIDWRKTYKNQNGTLGDATEAKLADISTLFLFI
jgi:hypothetical protein